MDKSTFVKFFAFSAGEFLDEELFFIAARIAKAEGKTLSQVETEITPHLDFKTVQNGPHPFQMWGSLDLLARIHATSDVVVD